MEDWSAHQQKRNLLKFLENEKAETHVLMYTNLICICSCLTTLKTLSESAF